MRRETTENLGHEDMRLEERDSKPVHCAMLRRNAGARTGQDGAGRGWTWGFWQLFQRCFQSVCASAHAGERH